MPPRRQNDGREQFPGSSAVGLCCCAPAKRSSLTNLMGFFWDGIAQDGPAKLGSGMGCLAAGVSFQQAALGAGGRRYGFGCCVGCDLAGRGELI